MPAILNVTPEALAANSAQIAELMAETSSQLSAFSAQVTSTVPAGVDSGSLLASTNFAAHGVDFVVTGAASQVTLGTASAAVAHMAATYAQQEAANAALLG